MAVKDGKETKVVDSISGYGGCVNLAVGDHGIFFTRDNEQTVKSLDFATGKIEEIMKLRGELACGFALSPDGRYFLYTEFVSQSSSAELMLVENFK